MRLVDNEDETYKNIGREDDDIKGKAVGLKVNEKSKDLGSFVTKLLFFSRS